MAQAIFKFEIHKAPICTQIENLMTGYKTGLFWPSGLLSFMLVKKMEFTGLAKDTFISLQLWLTGKTFNRDLSRFCRNQLEKFPNICRILFIYCLFNFPQRVTKPFAWDIESSGARKETTRFKWNVFYFGRRWPLICSCLACSLDCTLRHAHKWLDTLSWGCMTNVASCFIAYRTIITLVHV